MPLEPPRLVHIALGSNEGDRYGHLQKAIFEIYQDIGEVIAISAVYETPAWGFSGNAFLNACAVVRSRLEPTEILKKLLKIELFLGRQRKAGTGYQNRTIDLDILLVEDEIIDSDTLQVPHPGMLNRKFVLLPLNDIASEMLHPVEKRKIQELLKASTDKSEISKSPESLKKPEAFTFAPHHYIAIEGNIGAGKTSFATMLSQDLQAKLILERFKDNPFLPKFYKEPSRYAFSLEMSFLVDRYQQLSDDLSQYNLFTDLVISDYDILKSLIFAKVTLQEDEFSLYQKLFGMMNKDLVKPDLYIFLYQSPNRLLENIKNRGRDYEQNIEREYLENINKSYLSFIDPRPNVRIIDISELDFVNNRRDYLKVLEEIRF